MKAFLLLFLAYCLSGGGLHAQQRNSTSSEEHKHLRESGAIIRGDTTQKTLALVFTGDSYAEGGEVILEALKEHDLKGSFFFTGNFYRNSAFKSLISNLKDQGHYLGAHSDQHLLYNDWTVRDSLLISQREFRKDLWNNYREMESFGIKWEDAPYYLPPYEWYNDSISIWTKQEGLQLINITYGTLSHADYTSPDMPNFRNSEEIYQSIVEYEETSKHGLNGFLLLIHIGVGPDREDKFYGYLHKLLPELKSRGYSFARVDELLGTP